MDLLVWAYGVFQGLVVGIFAGIILAERRR